MGQGEVPVQKKVLITVPPGSDSGHQVRMKGKGQRDASGKSGDVIVTFQVKPDKFLRRDGLDIHCKIPVNLVQAMLGTKVKVRTAEGKKVVLKVPPGTQPGRKFRIKGLGVKKANQQGDQLVEIDV